MSHRGQTRLFFQQLAPSQLAGTTKDAVISRCEAYLAAVRTWADAGNAQVVRQASTGLTAVCAWKAARSLAENVQIEHFQRLSGLSPQQFAMADRDLTPAITSSFNSQPTTPRRGAIEANVRSERSPFLSPSAAAPAASSAGPSGSSFASTSPLQALTPEARQKRMRDVMTGAAFLRHSPSITSSPLSQAHSQQRCTSQLEIEDQEGQPSPTARRTLRDRSSIKETRIYDPSEITVTPTKRKGLVKTTVASSSSPSVAHTPVTEKRLREAIEDVTTSPSKQVKEVRKRRKLILEYPAGEPLRVGRAEMIGEWDSRNSKDRIQRTLTALEHYSGPNQWEPGQAVGLLNLGL